MRAMPEGAANSSPSALPVATANQPEQTRPIGRAWIAIGVAVTLIGLVMGFIMSSVGS